MQRFAIVWVLCFFTFTNLAAQQVRQEKPLVSIRADGISLKEVLEQITSQTGLNFSFNASIIALHETVEFSAEKDPLEKVLDKLCRLIHTQYTILGNNIILTREPDHGKAAVHQATLSGFVTDRSTGESLIGATVELTGSNRGTITNEFGFYALQIPPGTHQVEYSYIGYQKQSLSISLEKDVQKNLYLEQGIVELPNVVVARSDSTPIRYEHLDRMQLSAESLSNMPEFAGETGLVNGLQSLPGIQMHSDGSPFFYVRGGGRDQNLIIIDDAPIYNPSHLFGLYSIVIPDFAKSIDIYKSDMPANLGDQLSSIVSIRTKDGNLNKLELRGALNPLINRFSIETPVVKEKGSIFVSLRRSNFEWIYKNSNPDSEVSFGDFIFKWNHKINHNNRLYLTTILSGDKFLNTSVGNLDGAGVRSGNVAATLRWNHIFGSRLFSNTTLYTGNYAFRLAFEPNYWQSALGTLSLKTDFTHYTSARYQSKFGLEAQGYFIDPGSFSLDSTLALLPSIKRNYSGKWVVYYQGAWDVSKTFQLNAGIRMIKWDSRGPARYYEYDEQFIETKEVVEGEGVYHSYFHLDPRISLQWNPLKNTSFQLCFGQYHQYLQFVSNSVSPFTATEIWLPASPDVKPQSSLQWALNVGRYFEKPGLLASAAFFYKKQAHQINLKPHATTLLKSKLEAELRFGELQSHGTEWMLKKENGRLNGWLSYTYTRSWRQTTGINQGKRYPATHDRPHEWSTTLNYRWTNRLSLSTYWTYFSGSTFSSPTGFYTFKDQTIPIFATENNDRLPAYHRVDFALKYILHKNPQNRYQHSLNFSIYNTFLHKNAVDVNFNKISNHGASPLVKTNLLSEVPLQASQIDLIRFFPSLTYKFKL